MLNDRIFRGQREGRLHDRERRFHRLAVHGDVDGCRSHAGGRDSVDREPAVVVRGGRARDRTGAESGDSIGQRHIGHRSAACRGKREGRIAGYVLRQRVVAGQRIGCRIDGERGRCRIPAVHPDGHGRIVARGRRKAGDRERAVAVRRGFSCDVSSAESGDAIPHGGTGHCARGDSQAEADVFGSFPLVQRTVGGQSIDCGIDGERGRCRAAAVHRDAHGGVGAGCRRQAGNRERAVAVRRGFSCDVFSAESGNQIVHGGVGYRACGGGQFEADVFGGTPLVQRIVGGKRVAAAVDVDCRLCRVSVVYLGIYDGIGSGVR